MEKIQIMKVGEAYEKSQTSELADTIWSRKHPGEPVDSDDREYISWRNSIPFFLRAAKTAGLSNLDVTFEFPTPLGDYIDVILLGSSKEPDEGEFGRILIVELKQWTKINQIDNRDYVEIPIGSGNVDIRRHPISQVCEYELHMSRNHSGIYKKKGRIKIDTLAYLHNFTGDRHLLLTEAYSVWNKCKDKIYCKVDEQRLVKYLQETFSEKSNDNMADVIGDCGYVMDEAGFEGLKSALSGEENATMVKDEMSVVDCVRTHLEKQKENPQEEIIVVSAGPGTGKTIIGMHFIYDYAEIFNKKQNADGAAFCLPRSKTVKVMIDYKCGGEGAVTYLDSIQNKKLVVVDEAHRITGLESTLDSVFDNGTKLLIMLQDDHQKIRADEDGTVEKIAAYAKKNRIVYTQLYLTIQKRCESLGKLLDGLRKMFYDEGNYNGEPIPSVKVFDQLEDMDEWINSLAKDSRSKFIAPYCWEWPKKDEDITDTITISKFPEFHKSWNPESYEQAKWYYGMNNTNQVASIYTCQGLDFDNVAFIWYDDLVWDDTEQHWKSNIEKSKDWTFRRGIKDANLSPKEIDMLFINTYYVMLSRARKNMGIWFMDEATKRHVMEFLGLELYSREEAEQTNGEEMVIGNKLYKNYHKLECIFAPTKPEKRIEFKSVADAIAEGYTPCETCYPR